MSRMQARLLASAVSCRSLDKTEAGQLAEDQQVLGLGRSTVSELVKTVRLATIPVGRRLVPPLGD